jgi:hypothetical protein
MYDLILRPVDNQTMPTVEELKKLSELNYGFK